MIYNINLNIQTNLCSGTNFRGSGGILSKLKKKNCILFSFKLHYVYIFASLNGTFLLYSHVVFLSIQNQIVLLSYILLYCYLFIGYN